LEKTCFVIFGRFERLQAIERREERDRLRYRQEREMENMSRYDSYPYWDSADEHRSLYEDSLEEDDRSERTRDDIMRSRMKLRGGKKSFRFMSRVLYPGAGKKGKRRPFYRR